eukprot:9034020-Pyramimonas_sp.AAC.1
MMLRPQGSAGNRATSHGSTCIESTSCVSWSSDKHCAKHIRFCAKNARRTLRDVQNLSLICTTDQGSTGNRATSNGSTCIKSTS